MSVSKNNKDRKKGQIFCARVLPFVGCLNVMSSDMTFYFRRVCVCVCRVRGRSSRPAARPVCAQSERRQHEPEQLRGGAGALQQLSARTV